jgi:hypothetical protein
VDDDVVFPKVLIELDKSPLWAWDSPPVLWALLCEDPVIITPALVLPSVEHLTHIAGHWMEQMPANAVAVDTLALTIEGVGLHMYGPATAEFRDAIVCHRDGTMRMFRHIRNSGVTSIDPTEQALPAIEAMREVGASAWR